jgi:hypothetical protein
MCDFTVRLGNAIFASTFLLVASRFLWSKIDGIDSDNSSDNCSDNNSDNNSDNCSDNNVLMTHKAPSKCKKDKKHRNEEVRKFRIHAKNTYFVADDETMKQLVDCDASEHGNFKMTGAEMSSIMPYPVPLPRPVRSKELESRKEGPQGFKILFV